MGTHQITADQFIQGLLATQGGPNDIGNYQPGATHVDPSTGQSIPNDYNYYLSQLGGNPNAMLTVPFGGMRDQYAALATPFLGAAGAALLAPAGAAADASAAGAGGASAAGASGAYDATAAGIDAGGISGVGGAGSLATGMSGAVGDGLSAMGAAGAGTAGLTGGATGGAMDSSVPSFDQILANAQSGSTLSTAGSPADYFSAGGVTTGSSSLDSLLSGLGGGSSLFSGLSNVGNGLSSLGSSGGGNNSILSALGNIGSGSMSLLPGLLALNYARNTAGIDTSGLSGILGKLGGNQDAVIKAATDPFQQNIAAGYGDLLQSQAARGIRGSSFGDTDIANYLSTTGNSLANAGANAAQGSLALQGNLAGEIAQLNNQSQLQKNQLYGNAFDVLGRALNPAGYAGSINLGGPNGGFTQTGSGNTISGVGQLISGLGSLGSTLYNWL